MVAGNAGDFGDDRQDAKARTDFVEGEPDARATRDAGGLDAADVTPNFRARRQVDARAGLQRLKGTHAKPAVLPRALGAEFIFEPHQEFRAGSDRVGLDRQVGGSAPIGRFGRIRRAIPRNHRRSLLLLRVLLRSGGDRCGKSQGQYGSRDGVAGHGGSFVSQARGAFVKPPSCSDDMRNRLNL
jgi:hypothetical protein